MPALANSSDVETALRRDLTSTESQYVDGLIDTAADLVTGYLYPCKVPTPVPGAVTRVVADMVAAVFNRPSAIPTESESLNAGMYGVKFATGATSPGPYLTAAFKERLKPYRCGGGVVSVQLGSERY